MKSNQIIQLNAISQTIDLLVQCIDSFKEFKEINSLSASLHLAQVRGLLKYTDKRIKDLIEELEEDENKR